MLDASTTAALVAVTTSYQAEHRAGILAISHDTDLLYVWADHVIEWRNQGQR